MARRIHVSGLLQEGTLELDAGQAHHVHDVLRLRCGDRVEVFDDAGNVAQAVVERCDATGVSVSVETIQARELGPQIVIASAVPKGERADWMVEKLSELGVHRFIPLQTARSVVHPKGGKLERWRRIATESAKQCRRAGVMQIDEMTPLSEVVRVWSPSPRRGEEGYFLFLSTDPRAAPILSISSFISRASSLCLLIGPEGGWTDEEIELFRLRGLTGVKLTQTILRVETAAVAAGVVAMIAPDRECPPAQPRAIGSESTHT